MNNQITINNIVLDKLKLLRLIDNNKKIQAIKYIKDETNLGLKASKDIVDNLEENPDYYSDKKNTIIASVPKTSNAKRKLKGHNAKGSHIIKNKQSLSKNAIIIFLLIVICLLIFLLNK